MASINADDTDIQHWIINIKHIFLITVFFDALVAKYHGTASVFVGPEQCLLGRGKLWTTRYNGYGCVSYLLWFDNDQQAVYKGFLVKFPDWQTTSIPTESLILTTKCVASDAAFIFSKRRIKDLHFTNLFN